MEILFAAMHKTEKNTKVTVERTATSLTVCTYNTNGESTCSKNFNTITSPRIAKAAALIAAQRISK